MHKGYFIVSFPNGDERHKRWAYKINNFYLDCNFLGYETIKRLDSNLKKTDK